MTERNKEEKKNPTSTINKKNKKKKQNRTKKKKDILEVLIVKILILNEQPSPLEPTTRTQRLLNIWLNSVNINNKKKRQNTPTHTMIETKPTQ